MGSLSMEQLLAAGAFVGGLIYAFWSSHFGSRRAVRPISDKQDETLKAINIANEGIGRVQERVDEIADDHAEIRTDVSKLWASQKNQGERIGQTETDLGELRGRVGTIEKLHEARGCLAVVATHAPQDEVETGGGPASAGPNRPGESPPPPRVGNVSAGVAPIKEKRQ